MGAHHYGKILKRIFCALIAIAVFADFYAVSASVAEESTVQAAKTGTKGLVYGPSRIADPVASRKVTEPLSSTITDGLPEEGEVSGPSSSAIADVSPEAGEVSEPLDASLTGENDAPAADLFASENPEDEESYDLILAVWRKGDILSSEVVGIEKGFNYYLPVLGMARTVLFPSESDLAAGKITGTFFNPENGYAIDTRSGTYTVGGETFPLPEGSYIVRDLGQNIGDIYVTPEVINQLWPLDLEINSSELTVDIKTKKLLPYEQERERKKRQERLADGRGGDEKPRFEFIPNTYKLLGRPMFNLSESVMWDDHEKQFLNSVGIDGRGDMLGASADYTLNMDYNSREDFDINNLRFRLTREDKGDGSLPFNLKMLQVGDVNAKPSPLINKFYSGRGVFLSTNSKPRNQAFDEVTIDGTAQPGWEVELYRGNQLLDFGFVDESGQYRFDNVPLNFGNNDIKVVLYGPQGQIEERANSYQIKRTQLAAGESTIEASVLDNGVPLFDLRDQKADTSASSTKTVRVNRGISPWITGFATLTQTPGQFNEDDKKYATVGAEFNALGGAGQVELYRDFDGGNIIDTRFGTNFSGLNTSFRTSFIRDFESREIGFGDSAKTFEGEFRAGKSFNIGTSSLGLNFDTLHTRQENGKTTTRSRFSQSYNRDRYGISNSIGETRSNRDSTTVDGTVALNTVLSPRWNARSSLTYDLKPESEVKSARVDLRYSDLDKFSAGVDVERGLNDNDTTHVGLTAGYDFSTFLGSVDLDWDSRDGVDAIIRASTTLGPDGENGNYIFTTQYKGQQTALKIRLFHDKNSNGVFDEGDEPVEGGKAFVGNLRTKESDAEGYIELLGAGAPGVVDITVDQESLPDPFLVPLKPGLSTVLRERSKPYIELALVESGGIDGTVRFADGRPIPGLTIQLLSHDGVVIKETTTLSDGFYAFEFVKPGTYTVQVAVSHQINVPPITVSVTSEEIFVYGADLTLLEQAAEVSAADEADGESGRVAQLHHAPVAEGTLQPAPYSSDGGFQTVVRSVRIGEHPYRVRLVLDLSGPTGYKISSENGGEIINIDLPSTAWDADRMHDLSKHPMLSQCEALSLDGGKGTRLRLTARTPMEVFYNATLPPAEGLSDRIYIDFMKAGTGAH